MEAVATASEGGAPEVSGDVKDLPTPTEKPQEPPKDLPKAAERRKYKLKVDGREEDWEGTDDDLVKELQMSRASQRRFEQASQMYKKVQPLLSAKEKGDLDQLLDGVPDDKRREWAEKYLGEWLKLQEMDPKERELLEKNEKIEQYEKQEQEREKQTKEAQEKAVRQHLAKQASQAIESDIAEVLQDIPPEKRSPRLVARIAEEMLTHFRAGKGRLPAKQAFERARSNLETDVNQLLGSMDGEQLTQYLPKEVVNKVLKYHADKVKSQSPFGQRKASTPSKTPGKQERMTTDDYFNKLDEKFRS